MTQDALYDALIVAWFALAAVTFVALFAVSAPYGRHARQGWGPAIGDKAAWVLMEAPAALVLAACFVLGTARTLTSLVFLALWEVHYLHRAFVYPLRVRDSRRRMPLSVVGMGLLFNVANGYLNGRYLYVLSGGYSSTWLGDLRFLAGLGLFAVGYVINRQADRTLRDLRASGASRYQIPQGGLYRWISCPNYLGEIVEWAGWALATWSLPGLAFAVWTAANLAPRAWAHHRWYLAHMPDYPPERKAMVPGVW